MTLLIDAVAGQVGNVSTHFQNASRTCKLCPDVEFPLKKNNSDKGWIPGAAARDISELHVGLKGTMDALFLKALAAKTRRGLRGSSRAARAAAYATATSPSGSAICAAR
jgi:hypothetical protein